MADLEARHGRQRELEALSAEDSDQLLRRMGIDDPAWRAAVYDRLANGHPLLTEMAGELWKAAKEAGDPLPAGDIPHLAGHERAVDWLTGRILDRLVEPLKGAGRWAALLRRFDADVLRACLDPGLPPLGEDDYERLRRFSFVERARGGAGYACHDLLRRVQTHYLHDNEPAAFRAFHARAAAYFAPSDDLEALYHRLALAEEAAFDEWQGAVNEAEFAWDWPRWGGLLDLAGSPELPLTEAQQGRVWEKRAGWRYRRGQPEAALEALRHAIDLLERVGDQLGVAMAYNNIGEVYRAQGEYAQALEWYGKSVAITEKLGDQAGLAPTYNNIGFVYKARGEYDQALEWYGKSATITEKLGDQASLATIYNNVGVAYKSRGEYAQALEWYGKSVAITEQLGDHFMQAASYNNIGAVYFARGDYDQALEWYRKSVTILEKLGDQAGLATAYNNVGEVYRARGDYDQALEWHVKGLSITEKLGDQAGLARSYNNIAFVHYVRGEFGATVAMLERSLAIFERIGARANADTVRANLEQVKQETRNGWRD
jgi:tetratricopeptide (TPR) repeat protein